jgi:hypothetical protein
MPIKRVNETKALRVYIDEFLSWNKHVEEISKNISSGIEAVRKLKSYVDNNMHVNMCRQCTSFTAF